MMGLVQWYPGHMAKARRILNKDLKLIDLVVEVLDARIPVSSQNPDLDELIKDKKRILALNKYDLADPGLTRQWLDYFTEKYQAVRVNSLNGEGINELIGLIKNYANEINQRITKKGRNKREIRIMIIGIPNVGKSALINALAGMGMAKTGNRPGVTRGRQWIKIGDDIQLLDTPGILWPKFDDEDIGYKLAITGAISDDVYDREMAAYKLITYLLDINQDIIEQNYQLELSTAQAYDILPLIGRKRGCLMSGGKVDRARTAKTLIHEFRRGKLGRVTLEKPIMGD